jgi:hypothetical protein
MGLFGEKMARFKVEMNKQFLNFKMRDLFPELIDYDVENPEEGYLKSFHANYGYVSFWYGWIDEDALEKHFRTMSQEAN